MFSFGLGFLRGALSTWPSFGSSGILYAVETREVGVHGLGMLQRDLMFSMFPVWNSCVGLGLWGEGLDLERC